MDEQSISLEHNVGRIEGKLDLILTNQTRVQDCMQALHNRVDDVEDDMVEVKSDQRIFKRDIKWTLGIGAALLAGLKWLFTSVIK